MRKVYYFVLIGFLLIDFNNSKAQNWQFAEAVPTTKDLYSVCFPSSNTGYVVGGQGTIMKSTDGGNIWVNQSSNISQNIYCVKFLNNNIGWAVGEAGTILKTLNGGSSWVSRNYGTSNNYSIFIASTDTVFVISENGQIIRTVNGGDNWSIISSSPSLSPQFKTIDTCFSHGGVDTIMMSVDTGHTWNAKVCGTGTYQYFSRYFFVTPTIGYSLSINGIGKSVDGGESWNCLLNNFPDYSRDMFFTDTQTGYVIGENYSGDAMPHFLGSEILKTIDGGVSWISQNNLANWQYLYGIYFIDTIQGIIVGSNGTILISSAATNVIENYPNSGLNVYPNPSTDIIHLDNNSDSEIISIMIYDIQGKEIIKKIFQNNHSMDIDIAELKSGLYLMKIQTKNILEIKKIMVK